MNKPFVILQLRPQDAIADSEYACIKKYGGLTEDASHRLRIERNGIPHGLKLDNYAGIIVGGSPFDISTPARQKSFTQRKIEDDFHRLLDQVVPRDFPFLGCCSGNGLLGNYLGSGISKKYGEAVGCVPVELTEAGKDDKLLNGFPSHFNVLLGHKEACDTTPPQATLLVTGSACPVQMFRVGNNLYATQFYPEGDAEEFILRIDTYRNHGYLDASEAEQLKKEVSRASTPYAQEILRRFVHFYGRTQSNADSIEA